MHDDQLAFLTRLVETTGPSGYEWQTQQVWRERVQDVADQVHTDALGNCFATLNPSGSPRLMIEAHIDEIGFIVKYIDERGYVYFDPIGGFDGSTLPGGRVRIMGRNGPVIGVIGRAPIHNLSAEDRKNMPELKDMWIDLGVRDRAGAEAVVAVGDAGGRSNGLQRLHGNVLASNSFDDRAGAYVIAEAFRALAASGTNACVVAVSSVQEEIGLRGAVVSAYTADVPIGICLEVNWTTDDPFTKPSDLGVLRLGGGPILGRGACTNPRIFRRLADAANAEGIEVQIKADAEGTANDENVMQMSRAGMATGLLKVPTRYLHTASEVLSTDDIDQCVTLLCRFVRDLDPEIDTIP
jgi:tetrahedral aminopeptidase